MPRLTFSWTGLSFETTIIPSAAGRIDPSEAASGAVSSASTAGRGWSLRLSIVVPPFANIGGDSEQVAFNSALAEGWPFRSGALSHLARKGSVAAFCRFAKPLKLLNPGLKWPSIE